MGHVVYVCQRGLRNYYHLTVGGILPVVAMLLTRQSTSAGYVMLSEVFKTRPVCTVAQ